MLHTPSYKPRLASTALKLAFESCVWLEVWTDGELLGCAELSSAISSQRNPNQTHLVHFPPLVDTITGGIVAISLDVEEGSEEAASEFGQGSNKIKSSLTFSPT
jgi:hypothetical protein